jgi:GNAT superfamily N-acetyltransferase
MTLILKDVPRRSLPEVRVLDTDDPDPFPPRVPRPARLPNGARDLEVLADENVVRPTDLDLVDCVRAVAQLEHAMVASGWRGRGVGTALVAAAIEWARARGLHRLSLSVFPHNEAAIALYRKFGFLEEGRRAKHMRRANGDLWDLIEMGLLLSRYGCFGLGQCPGMSPEVGAAHPPQVYAANSIAPG